MFERDYSCEMLGEHAVMLSLLYCMNRIWWVTIPVTAVKDTLVLTVKVINVTFIHVLMVEPAFLAHMVMSACVRMDSW